VVTVGLQQPPRRNQGVGEGVDSRDAGEQHGDRATVAPLRVLFVDDEAPIREVSVDLTFNLQPCL